VWFKAPRVYPNRIKAVKRVFKDAGVGIASLLPMYRWGSNHEVERRAAVKHCRRSIEIAVELGVDTMNSEFGHGPHPDKGSCYCCHTGSMIEACEDAWWRSMEELVPVFEKEGINLHVEPHPEEWCGTIQRALVNSRRVKFLYCAPHTYYFGDDTAAMLRESADVLAHVHVGDTFNHKASSGLRYILNPPGAQARVHQHLDIGQGEVPWDDFFGTLAEIGFAGIMTACVFAWEDRADASSSFVRRETQRYVDKFRGTQPTPPTGAAEPKPISSNTFRDRHEP
jgi:myo-inositol catabolism protein IolH